MRAYTLARTWRRGLIAVAGVLLAGDGLAAQGAEPIEVLDTVLVIGEQPGPGLWKVSRDANVLWVLPALRPLPKDLTWRTSQIEARIAGSSEVLYRGDIQIGADIGILRGLTLVPAALNARKIPGGRTLKDVLPADAYAQWRALRAKYLGGDDDVERLRPALAMSRLRSAAFRKQGLQGGPDVYEVIGRLRKKHKVKQSRLEQTQRTVRVEKPRNLMREVSRVDVPDVPCFIRELAEVETDIERARQVANAWSRGNVQQLRALHRDPVGREALEESCAYILLTAMTNGEGADAARAKKLFADLEWHAEWASVQSKQEWVTAAREALQRNESTFAVLPLDDVLRPGGHLDALRALGYTVEEPL